MVSPDVLIIIPNYNGEEFLGDCLASIESNTDYPDDSYQVLVVDNGSSDGSDNIAEQMGAETYRNDRNLGFDIAHNIGIYRNPEYEYYMLLNNDTEVRPRWLTELIEGIKTVEGGGVAGPKILYPDGKIQTAGHSFPNRTNLRKGASADSFQDTETVDAVHGAGMLIKSDAVEDIGYLDEIFTPGGAEEFDYCKRARLAGYKVVVVGQSEVVHKEDKTKDQIESELMYMVHSKNKIKYELMNGTPVNILAELWTLLKRFVGAVSGYNYHPFLPLMAVYKEILVDIPSLIYKRYNRDEPVPTYYCEGIKDYSRRYVMHE